MNWRKSTSIIASCITLTLAPIGFISNAAGAQQPIKVGAIVPLSGGAGPQGQGIVNALKAMATIINEDGGVMGRPIQIISRDDESTPAIGVSRATELISDGVSVFVGGFNSPVALATQPVIARANIFNIIVSPKADAILSGKVDPYAVRLNSSNAEDGSIIAAYIANTAKAKRVAFLTENDAYGKGAQEAIEKALDSLGYDYTRVADEKFPFAQTDFRIPMTSIVAAKPDVTVVTDANESLGMPSIIRQARQSNLPGKIVGAVGTIIPAVVKTAGNAANGVISADFYASNIEPFISNPVHERFVRVLKKDFDTVPDKYMAIAAVGLQTWAQAANNLKTLDRKILGENIRGGAFKNTVMGQVKFESNGQLVPHYFVQIVKDGKITVLE